MKLPFNKRQKDKVQSEESGEVEEKVTRAERDMEYLEAQIRVFRREQERASR